VLQRFEPVAGQCRKVLKRRRRIEAIQPQLGLPVDSGKRLHAFPFSEVLRALVSEADDHSSGYHGITQYVKRNERAHRGVG